jgi:hypothetical protein
MKSYTKKYHNIVEQKGRDKIRRKMDELKELLNSEINKNITRYEILSKSVDYIKLLIKEKECYYNELEILKIENHIYKMCLIEYNINNYNVTC